MCALCVLMCVYECSPCVQGGEWSCRVGAALCETLPYCTPKYLTFYRSGITLSHRLVKVVQDLGFEAGE